MASDDHADHASHEDTKVHHGMGYAQELSRSMSTFSNFAISFPIICILCGGINSFARAIDISRLSSFPDFSGAAGGGRRGLPAVRHHVLPVPVLPHAAGLHDPRHERG